MIRRLLAVLSLVCIAVAAGAQTNDHYYRSWSWRTETGLPRAMGLAGAFVAMAGDPANAWLNPAGLARLQELALSGGGMWRGAGAAAIGDAWSGRSGLGYVAGGTRLTSRWAIGGYLIEPHAANITLGDNGIFADGTIDTGSLRAIVTEVGGAVAWHAGARVDLGARVTLSHLELEGMWTQTREAGQLLRVGTAAGASRITASFGAQLEVSESLRLGILGDTGVSYECDRTAVSPALGIDLEVGGRYDLRQPSRLAVGATWKASNKVRLVAQTDYVRYGEIETSIRHGVGQPAEYSLDDAVEPRGGIEVSIPVGKLSVQLRGGVHYRAASGPQYGGSDNTERSAWLGQEAGIEGSAGAAILGGAWQVDVGGVVDGLRSAVTVGLTVRP